jgi:hypothetical protein
MAQVARAYGIYGVARQDLQSRLLSQRWGARTSRLIQRYHPDHISRVKVIGFGGAELPAQSALNPNRPSVELTPTWL